MADYYAGQPLPDRITVGYLRQLQRYLFDLMTAWQSRTPKIKPDRIRIKEALQQAATNFVFSTDEAAALIKRCTLRPDLEPDKKKEEQPESKEEEKEEDEDPFADVHNPSLETVSENEFFAAKELAEAQ